MPKFYAACLASYNNGVLHGAWIDASSDEEEMQEAINKMLRESKFPNVTVTICCPECHNLGETFPGVVCKRCNGVCEVEVPSAEEWAIHDTENLPENISEYSGLKPIADYVEFLEDHPDMDEGDLLEIYEDYGSADVASEALKDNYVGIYDDFSDYAYEVADELISDQSKMVQNYFDYKGFARDLEMDYHTVKVPSGVAIFYA